MIPVSKPFFTATETKNIARCLATGHVTQGPQVQAFERAFASFLSSPHAVAVTSCGAALHLAVKALGLGPGDEVVVPAFTWVATAHAVEYAGAKVVFADVSPQTYNITDETLEEALTPATRAVIPVHLFGLPAPMHEITLLSQKHGFYVIEDAACAIGATDQGRLVGTWGDIGCFSFHPRKIITTGEGGMLTTFSDTLHNALLGLRNYGANTANTGEPCFDTLGLNFRMSDILAAVGLAQIAKLGDMLQERKKLAEDYSRLLLRFADDIALPSETFGTTHAWQAYVIRIMKGGKARRNSLIDFLHSRGIQARIGTQAVQRLPYYTAKYGVGATCPMASLCEETSMAIPFFNGMSVRQQKEVCAAIEAALLEHSVASSLVHK